MPPEAGGKKGSGNGEGGDDQGNLPFYRDGASATASTAGPTTPTGAGHLSITIRSLTERARRATGIWSWGSKPSSPDGKQQQHLGDEAASGGRPAPLPRNAGAALLAACIIGAIGMVEFVLMWCAIEWDPNKEIRQEPLVDHFANFIAGWWWIPVTFHEVFVIGFLYVGCTQTTWPLGNWFLYGAKRWTAVRSLRIVTFLSVTIPNPVPGCYIDRFQAERELRGFWAMALSPKLAGGCNDLLFSGHCVVSWLTVMMVWGTPGYRRTAYALGSFAAVDALHRIQSRKHYSVDVFLSFLIVTLLYTATLKPRREPRRDSQSGTSWQ